MNITTGKIAKAQKITLYGPEGIGKSTFASKFPNPLFIDIEGSTSNMDVARMDKPTSWTFLRQQIEYVKQNHACKTLIIDTMDWAERMAIEHICQENKKKSIEDFGYGSGYIKLEEEIGRFLNLLQDVVDQGINVILNAHAQIRKFEQPDEMGAYDRWELKLGKKTSARTSSLVKEWADMVLFINYKTMSVATDNTGKKHKGQGGQRTVYATHHPAWDAKNRHDLPDEFPLDYGYIAHIFDQAPQQGGDVGQTEPVTQTPIDQPASVAETTATKDSQPEPSPQINPSLPQSLKDLMIENNVSEEEIQIAVAKKGYYTQDTPILNYGNDYIEGVLVGAWDSVFETILEFRKSLPFS